MSKSSLAAEPQAQVEKLAFNTKETCQALGISPATLWRYEQRKLIAAVSGIGKKLYSARELRRFVDQGVKVA